MNVRIDIQNSVRVEVCQEAFDDALPLLNYCIAKHTDTEVRANMVRIRDAFPQYIQIGNVEVVSMAAGFVKETYDQLVSDEHNSNVEPTQALFYLAEINALLKAMGARLNNSAEIAQRVFQILQPMQQNGLTPGQFIHHAKTIIEELKQL